MAAAAASRRVRGEGWGGRVRVSAVHFTFLTARGRGRRRLGRIQTMGNGAGSAWGDGQKGAARGGALAIRGHAAVKTNVGEMNEEL